MLKIKADKLTRAILEKSKEIDSLKIEVQRLKEKQKHYNMTFSFCDYYLKKLEAENQRYKKCFKLGE